MKKYIIKVTFLEGTHKGKEYFLDKQGYVIDNLDYVWKDNSYTLSACKAACTRKEKNNTAEAIFEKKLRERKIAEGKTVDIYPIYEMLKYEPYEIETIDR